MTTIDSASTAGVTKPATDAEPRRRRGYGGLWAAVPRELGYLLLGFPIAIVAFTVLVTLFSTGVSLLVVVVGLAIVVAALYTARGFGAVELTRLSWAGRPEIRRPNWDRAMPAGEGPWRAFFAPFVDGHYWLYLLHGMVVAPVVALFSWTITLVWVSIGLGGVTYWIWAMFLPTDGRDVWPFEWVLDRVWPGGSAAWRRPLTRPRSPGSPAALPAVYDVRHNSHDALVPAAAATVTRYPRLPAAAAVFTVSAVSLFPSRRSARVRRCAWRCSPRPVPGSTPGCASASPSRPLPRAGRSRRGTVPTP